MKTSIAAIAITLAYMVSFVTADHRMVNDTGATSVDPTKRGKGSPSLFVPVGVISNDIDAKNNTILVTDSNIVVSLSDRVQLAHIIKDILPNAPETDPASTISVEDLFNLLSRIAKTPGMLPNTAGIISAAKSGNTGALAGHVVGLLRAAADPAAPVAAPTAAPIVPESPAVTPVDTPATPDISMAPMYMRSPMSPPVGLAAAATTST